MLTNTQKRTQAKRIKRLCRRWLRALGLEQWQLSFDLADEHPLKGHHDNAIAYCSAQWEYMQATIVFSPKIVDLDDSKLEYVFLHELTHAMINEMRDWDDRDTDAAMRHEERVVTLVSSALQRARNGVA